MTVDSRASFNSWKMEKLQEENAALRLRTDTPPPENSPVASRACPAIDAGACSPSLMWMALAIPSRGMPKGIHPLWRTALAINTV